ncbi:DUF4296 domain-containing protein [Hymenobacter busanensis]|uniref:DUF4296 domain-containing protein n=1 Tax=Hymenobacter busanensis TaxID=2607656 RepID=A0A7L4ZWJ0_9BACT|nr:DUF4296 domain-containing protein [Hymenobacter busanensis]KAA9327125.1 DUF4296 domain-containing protein [Hymenobacter busanensis]QHJ05790.1 DUF4296 domain-containing protein [Hymenobacter busanensis]
MKTPLFAFLLVLLGLFSQCGRPEDPTPPANLLPRDKMVSMLIDVHLLESRVGAANLMQDSATALFDQQLQELYWRQEVSPEVFRASYEYYAIHDKDLEELYKVVIDSLEQREFRLQNK